MRLILALCLLPAIAHAESATVARVLDDVILPGFAELEHSTQALSDAAKSDCRASSPALQDAYNTAFDAWVAVETYRAGPLETNGQGLAIAFWPDVKAATPKTLRTVLAGPIPQGSDFAETSVAVRGLFALEAMLFDPAFNSYGSDDPGCVLTQAIAADLAQTSAAVNSQWQTEFSPLMRTAGAQGNSRFLAPDEVIQQLFTAALTELEYISDVRIGRVLDKDRPRPNRAEARLSGRSLRDVDLSIAAVTKLAQALAGVEESEMFDRLSYVEFAAKKIKDPVFADA
ncbi:MAG: imelysin family protein, partial [Cypionkella sp.]